MKFLRFMDGQTPSFGILENGTVYRAMATPMQGVDQG